MEEHKIQPVLQEFSGYYLFAAEIQQWHANEEPALCLFFSQNGEQKEGKGCKVVKISARNIKNFAIGNVL